MPLVLTTPSPLLTATKRTRARASTRRVWYGSAQFRPPASAGRLRGLERSSRRSPIRRCVRSSQRSKLASISRAMGRDRETRPSAMSSAHSLTSQIYFWLHVRTSSPDHMGFCLVQSNAPRERKPSHRQVETRTTVVSRGAAGRRRPGRDGQPRSLGITAGFRHVDERSGAMSPATPR